jgi:protein O-mannosyl-transferase
VAQQKKPSTTTINSIYKIIPISILGVITALFYYPSIYYPFQFDDAASITKYFHVRNSSLSQLMFKGSRWISYWLNTIHYKIGKFNPVSYRTFNIFIHILCGVVIFFLLQNLLSNLKKESFFKANSLFIAFTTSMLFLLHPVQTQTISYIIQGQLEGLATLFIATICLAVVKFVQVKDYFIKGLFLSAVFVIAIFSTGSKEIAILSPIILFLMDWFFLSQGSWSLLKKRLPLYITLQLILVTLYAKFLGASFFCGALTMNGTTHNNIGNVINNHFHEPITAIPYFISEFKVILHYIWIFFWPFNISVEYDWKMVNGFFSPDCLLPFLVLVGIFYLTYRIYRKNRINPVLFGIAWFFIGISPRTTVIPSSELVSDYKTYLSSIGILFIIAIGIVKLLTVYINTKQKCPDILKKTNGIMGVLLILAVPLGIATYNRNLVWSDQVEFWKNIIKNAPGKTRAYNNYGVQVCERGRFKEGIPHFKKAIKMDPFYPDPHNNISICYSALGQKELAIRHLKESIKINPRAPEPYNNLASFLIDKNEYKRAEKALWAALKIRPHYGKAYYNLGRINFKQNNFEEAYTYLKKGCTTGDFDNELGYAAFGMICLKLKRLDEALWAYNKTLECVSTHNEALINIGNIYIMKNEGNKSIPFFEKAYQLRPGIIKNLSNLAEVYFKTKNYARALTLYDKFCSLSNNVQVFLRKAECLAMLGRKQECKAILQQIKKAPINKNILTRIQQIEQKM